MKIGREIFFLDIFLLNNINKIIIVLDESLFLPFFERYDDDCLVLKTAVLDSVFNFFSSQSGGS